MPCDCEFKPVIQVDCVLDIVRIIRGGTFLEERSQLLQDVGCVVGSLGKYLGDNTVGTLESVDYTPPSTLEDCADELERVVGEKHALGTTHGHEESIKSVAVNPQLLAILLKVIQLLIAKYL